MDFIDNNRHLLEDKKLMKAIDIDRYRAAHDFHHQTLDLVDKALREHGLNVEQCWRGQKPADVKHIDLIVTVGGDGTFLQSARLATNQVMLGVNSDPRWSVGQFCATDQQGFEPLLKKVLLGKRAYRQVRRLRLKTADQSVRVLNDVLLAHANPAAMSRYLIKLKRGTAESHRSSGLWIASAAGSTSAIRSAGGQPLPFTSTRWQYLPRELYPFKREKYQLTGGLLQEDDQLQLQSIMHDGCLFVDGAHYKIPLSFGQKVTLQPDLKPLKMIK